MEYVYLTAPIAAWLLAQFIKFASISIRERQLRWQWLVKSGGLPSSHSAIVASLTTVLCVVNGVQSAEFGISAVLMLIVVYDAISVRRAAGVNSELIAELAHKDDLELPKKFRIVLGHTPAEMIAGVTLGIVTGLVSTYGRWSTVITEGQAGFTTTELYAILALAALILIVSRVSIARLSRSAVKRLPSVIKTRAVVRWTAFAPAVVALLLIGAAEQGIRPFTWNGWSWALLGLVVISQIVLALLFYRELPRLIKEESLAQESTRKQARKRRKKQR